MPGPVEIPVRIEIGEVRTMNGCNYVRQPQFVSRAEDFVRRGWIQTYTGKRFSLARPSPEDIDIIDIAVALARIPRFLGHTAKFYSVAQHSWLASCHCEEYSLTALMHDAAEAYIGDLVRPLKLGLGEVAHDIEEGIQRAIWQRFGMRPGIPSEVKAIDNRLLATEQRDLMRHQLEWGDLATKFPPLEEKIEPWPVHESLFHFLNRFQLLSNKPVDWENVPHE